MVRFINKYSIHNVKRQEYEIKVFFKKNLNSKELF